ncbi:MAG: HesA/MoeB/ThiF family protein [Candidatus Magnetobacterium sp. LHC-1]|uniref:HesA/MoeB/ThiF family protein n=1 Tax=Candidatus Magnetobacterium casense TaxID=1455061 RepID=A0ABS6S0N5_9BACT|nr:HesA/MoeB/ThiF family protein [Candidatus Magnetobacterium casensis]MBF0607704.1 HesA/MoeB/ThiF family protein [Nitrospirota bacterium]MBV6342145.1 HesA/MoeB/ThiF family protein [Candidatus Magnetobacterium casensis]
MERGFDAEELERYRRQLMLEGFDHEHQQRLKSSTALIAGVGGLGGTAAVYLAVAGIGKMHLVHYGDLTVSNMNRQILMRHSGVGTSRVVQAKQTIQEINPDVEVEIFNERITQETIGQRLLPCDIALSARPNFHERRILNQACVNLDIPLTEGAMNGMEGYMFNIIPGKTACLNCIYPEDDPRWQELGFSVLGAVSGTLGCLMAIEAVKIITGFGTPLLSHLLMFNTFDMTFKKLVTRRSEHCKVCNNKNKLTTMG